MLTVSINQAELLSIGLIRVALSEPTTELREKAIANAKQEVMALQIATLNEKLGTGWMSDPQNAELAQWIATSSSERHEASYEFSQTARRYDERNGRKLNVAEHIGKLIWHSVQDNKFEGVQTTGGTLKQVSDQAQKHKISGAKDKDTLRGIWAVYRGVVHFGMAMDYCEEYPNHEQSVLDLAENYRRSLSLFRPKGTKFPYVPEHEKIMFTYKPTT